MATEKGYKIDANDINAIFDRLEELRAKHYARGDVNSSALATQFNTQPVQVSQKIADDFIELAKTYLSNLSNAGGISSNFSSNVTIPTVGSLLQATTFDVVENAVDDIEKNVCVNCSHFTAHFTSETNRSNFTAHFTAHFTSAANRTNFTHFSSATSRSNFTTNASRSNFSDFDSAASRGNFSDFSSNFNTNAQNGNFTGSQSSNFTVFRTSTGWEQL